MANPIIGFIGEEAYSLAQWYSEQTRRLFWGVEKIEDIEEKLKKSEVCSLTFIASREYFGHSNNAKIAHILSIEFGDRRFNKIPYGYLTARNLDKLKSLLKRNLKELTMTNETINRFTFLPIHDKEILHLDENHKIYVRSESNASNLVSTCMNNTVDTFAIVAHSSDDCIILGPEESGRTLICGAISMEPVAATNRAGCGYCGECIKNNISDMADISKLSLRHVFFDICKGIRLTGGSMSEDYSVGLRCLDSEDVVSLISTDKVKDGNINEAFLYQTLIDSGFTLGETVKILSNNLTMEYRDYDSFILIGDPLIRLKSSNKSSYKFEEKHLDNGVELVFKNISTNLIHIQISSDRLFNKLIDKGIKVQSSSRANKHLYYSAFPDDNENINLFIYAHKKIELDELVVNVLPDEEEIEINRIVSSIMNAQNLSSLNIKHSSTHHLLTELSSKLNNLASRQVKSLPTLYEGVKNQQLIGRIDELIDKVQMKTLSFVLQDVRNGPGILTEKYTESFKNTSFKLSEKLCSCGNQLYVRKNQHKVFNYLERYVLLCPRCSVVYDGPLESPLQAKLMGQETWGISKENSQSLWIKNDSGRERKVLCGISFSRQTRNLPPMWTPEIIELTVPRYGEMNYEWTTSCKGFDPHVHHLKGYILSDFEITYVHRPITLVP